MDETAAAGDLALPPAQFPWLPVALVSGACLVVLLILIVPPLARGMSPEATAALPAWIGRAYSGRCLMTARLDTRFTKAACLSVICDLLDAF